MPPDLDLDAEIDDILKSAGPSPEPGSREDRDLDNDVAFMLGASGQNPDDALGKPESYGPSGELSSDEFDAAAKNSKIIDMPVQSIAGELPKKLEAPKQWYDRFLPSKGSSADAALHGAGAGATFNWGEEGASALSGALSSVLPGMNDPEGYTREYAAGSRYKDMRDNLEAENAQLRKDRPAAFIGGQMLGAAPAAIAGGAGVGAATRAAQTAAGLAPAAAPVAEAALGGALTGGIAGAGAAPEGHTLEGAATGAGEGAIVGSALHGAGQGLSDVAKNATGAANRLLVQTFMTPAQRAKYELAKGGPQAIDQLGADAREAGLFGGPLRQLLPTRAKTVADNAIKVMQRSGDDITNFEQDLAARGVNPDVDIRPVVSNLRSAAAEESVPALDSPGASRLLTKQADLLEQPGTAQVQPVVPPPLPNAPLNSAVAPTTPVAQPGQQPVTGQLARESLPFSEATKLKRFLGKRIDWQKNPNAKASKYEQDAARKITWKGIGDQIDDALRNDPNVDPAALSGYSKSKKDFHTAATAFDPAIKMAEREGEVGLSGRDMLAGAAFGGNPLTGGLAALASKQTSGMLPSTYATGVRAMGAGAGLLGSLLKGGAKVTPIAQARRENPDASDGEVKRIANENVRKDLMDLLEQQK